jgi:hypothetical protein
MVGPMTASHESEIATFRLLGNLTTSLLLLQLASLHSTAGLFALVTVMKEVTNSSSKLK